MSSSFEGISRVGVIGGGIMGSGIAEVTARKDFEVTLVDLNKEVLESAKAQVARSLDRAEQAGKLDSAEQAMAQISFTDSLSDVGRCEIVVEAVTENKDVKLEVFSHLTNVVAEDTILASNTSSIPIVELATAANPMSANVIGMHFFNPVPVMSLVELIPSLLTDEKLTKRLSRFVSEGLGKDPIIAPDRAGFTVNALLIPYILAAIRMFEQGLASAEDIDRGMEKGCNHPMGPLRLADLIGLDTVLGVADTLYAEHREQLYSPPPLLQRLVSANLLGRKTKRGFYDYT